MIGRIALALLAVAGMGAASASCSLIVDTEADQCTNTADCAGFPGRSCKEGVCIADLPCSTDADCTALAGGTCKLGACVAASCTTPEDCGDPSKTCEDGVCVPIGGDCMVNADCATQGATFICRKDTKKCVNLQSTLCTTLHGDYKDDNALIIGSILPIQGADQSTGVPVENSIKLAINDFKTAANGLPPIPGSTARRPLVLVGCNDNSDGDTAVLAAKHLVDNVGVPAIIGGSFSGITIKFTTTVTIPANVLVISPSATSVAITDLQDNGLVWRTSPPDSFQAQAINLYIPKIDLGTPAPNPVKTAILHKGDAYGKGLATELAKLYTVNTQVDYGDPDDPVANPTKYPETINAMIGTSPPGLLPHLIFLFGTNETVTQVFKGIEEGWPTPGPGYRPRYVFADGGLITELWNYVAAAEIAMKTGSGDLRTRISGTVPGTNNALYGAFRQSFISQFPTSTPDVFGTAGAYDIVYMLGYAAATLASPQASKPVTGPNLAEGLKKLISGTPIDVGGSQINQAFTKLLAPSSIDYNGASGPLNFDVATGEAPSDIQIWCIPSKDPATMTAKAATNSGVFYDAANDKLVGLMFGPQCN